MRNQYDYVVVGAGSAGCVVASKLSEDPGCTVLLLESGPADTSKLISMPRGIGKLLVPGNENIWLYEAQQGRDGPVEYWVKGRTLGGSSSTNGMVYMRGSPADYDGWEAAGCTGWGWDEMRPCFVAMEDHALGPTPWRGSGGPLKVTVQPPAGPLAEAVIDAVQESGVPRTEDINAPGTTIDGGFGYQPRTINRGKRFSAANAFLKPALGRSNLDIAVRTDVLRLVFEGLQVTGVELRDAAGTRTVAAGREVILSAGAVETPKLLQLSGIGPAALLAQHDIAVVADRAEVGGNLQEHRYLACQFGVTKGSLNSALRGIGLVGSVLRYAFNSSGALSQAAFELGGFVRTRPEYAMPDVQIGVGLFSMKIGQMLDISPTPGITIGGYFLRPQSRGELRITSPDPAKQPYINANYLRDPVDREHAIAMVKWIRELVRQPALAKYIIGEQVPGAACVTDDDILDIYRTLGGPGFHVSGTCRMGSDDAAVVDPQLRVRGVEGLRIADCSIMPSIASGNTNGPAMAIGWRAAELIRAQG
jgi:choline dehydrogenase-like flavoprotein